MLAKRLIPCLDVKDGRVVKGVNFEGLRDAGDPVEAAARYDEQGADELCFLDITASHENRDTIVDIVKRTAERCFCPVTVGGGLRNVDDIRRILRSGADKVSVNSAAVKRPQLLQEGAQAFGAQCMVLAVDAKRVQALSSKRESHFDSEHGMPVLCKALGLSVMESLDWMKQLRDLAAQLAPEAGDIFGAPRSGQKRKTENWHVYIHGGRVDTGVDAVAWAQLAVKLGAGEILLTSMDADGTKSGYDLELTRAIAEAVSVPVIASGGAGNLQHLVQAFTEGQADAALAASIFHYGEYTLPQARAYLRERGISARQ